MNDVKQTYLYSFRSEEEEEKPSVTAVIGPAMCERACISVCVCACVLESVCVCVFVCAFERDPRYPSFVMNELCFCASR